MFHVDNEYCVGGVTRDGGCGRGRFRPHLGFGTESRGDGIFVDDARATLAPRMVVGDVRRQRRGVDGEHRRVCFYPATSRSFSSRRRRRRWRRHHHHHALSSDDESDVCKAEPRTLDTESYIGLADVSAFHQTFDGTTFDAAFCQTYDGETYDGATFDGTDVAAYGRAGSVDECTDATVNRRHRPSSSSSSSHEFYDKRHFHCRTHTAAVATGDDGTDDGCTDDKRNDTDATDATADATADKLDSDKRRRRR